MNPRELHEHIKAASRRAAPEAHRHTSRLLRACWPGGSQDRSERAALAWVQRWRPERIGAKLPACSCSTGRCAVCN
jgi:hypothetical protein